MEAKAASRLVFLDFTSSYEKLLRQCSIFKALSPSNLLNSLNPILMKVHQMTKIQIARTTNDAIKLLRFQEAEIRITFSSEIKFQKFKIRCGFSQINMSAHSVAIGILKQSLVF